MSQQQIHRFFGLTVQIVREIDASSYTELMDTFKKWLEQNQNIEGSRPELYIHKLAFDITPSKFKVVGIENRVQTLRITVAINPQQRKKKTMKFINDKVGHRLQPAIKHKFGMYENWYELSGKQLTTSGHFEEYLATAILKNVPERDRKVTCAISAAPTATYGVQTLKNIEGPVVTSLNFPLRKDVQLTLGFEAV